MDFFKERCWNDFLRSLGYEFINKDSKYWIHYQLNGWEFKYFIEDSILYGGKYIDYKITGFNINYGNDISYGLYYYTAYGHERGRALLTVLEAIADLSQAPLCIHIPWAKEIISKLLE
jgi:hypothetical protein